jgi:galactokinase
MKEELIQSYFKYFKSDAQPSVVFSPGRVNLIGEHIDYNGGFVFPFAINLGTYGVFVKNGTSIINIVSPLFSEQIYSIDLTKEIIKVNNEYTNYLKGMILAFRKKGYAVDQGFNLYIYSTMPEKSGLSSSASFELLTGYIIQLVHNYQVSRLDLVLYGKDAENNFVGVNSGILDQFGVGFGKEKHAILLNCSTLEYDLVPIKLDGYSFLVVNTNVKRELAGSAYNQRVKECLEALEHYQKHVTNLKYLCELSLEQVTSLKLDLNEPAYKRAKHCVSEQIRTIQMKSALKEANYPLIASLIHESHISLANDYEVSCVELNTLCDILAEAGYIGARMMGGGFGGCILGLVPTKQISHLSELIQKEYLIRTGIKPSVYVVDSSDSTKLL